jgi:hypothetical protein
MCAAVVTAETVMWEGSARSTAYPLAAAQLATAAQASGAGKYRACISRNESTSPLAMRASSSLKLRRFRVKSDALRRRKLGFGQGSPDDRGGIRQFDGTDSDTPDARLGRGLGRAGGGVRY